MTLVVEDGTGVTGANTYASIATVDAYHTAQANATWTGTDAVKEAAILRAMSYIESLSWLGVPYDGPVGASGYQPLEWPRDDIYIGRDYWPYNEIPPNVVKALCEAALVELVSAGSLAPSLERGGGIKRKKVDVLETEWFDNAPARTSYYKITQYLRGLTSASNEIVLERW